MSNDPLSQSKHPIRQAALNAAIERHKAIFPHCKHIVFVWPLDATSPSEMVRAMLLEDSLRTALNGGIVHEAVLPPLIKPEDLL